MNTNGFEYNKTEGNKLYQSCTEGVPDVLWSSRLKQSIFLYNEAMRFATNFDQKSSISKNLAMAHQKILTKTKDIDEQSYYFTETLKYFQQSILFAQNKPLEWFEHLNSNFDRIFAEGISLLEVLKKEKRITLFYKLRKYTAQFPESDLKLCCKIAEVSFFQAVEVTESLGFSKALALLEDSNQVFVIAKSLAKKLKKGDLVEDIADLEERRYIHLSRVEALRELQIARSSVETAIANDACVELMWDVVDRYRHTIRLTKGVDLEIEAICYCEIGDIFYTHLGLEEQSAKYFEQVLQLANSMIPRKLASTSWLALATNRLKDLQLKAAQKADEEEDIDSSKYYDELKPDFEAIAKANQDKVETFIDFLYKTYPPKNQPNAQRDATQTTKKQLLAAIILYHPDKNGTDDAKWRVLVTEITKLLNGRYEVYKNDI